MAVETGVFGKPLNLGFQCYQALRVKVAEREGLLAAAPLVPR
jgi:hypothetical protein